jgi:hypothetical protein
MPISPEWSLPNRFFTKNFCLHFSVPLCMLQVCIHLILFDFITSLISNEEQKLTSKQQNTKIQRITS